MSLLGVEVFAISTEPTAEDEQPGDIVTTPMGFVARMDKPLEIDTPDRDW